MAYLGTLGLAHGLETLIEVATRLRAEPEFVFLLIGDGAERAKLEAMTRERELENVEFLGLQPREEMPEWIATMDILLVSLRDLAVFRTVIPSKIFEFLAQERPVIVAARGEIREMVEKTESAWAIDPEDPEALIEAIREIASRPDEAKRRAAAGRRWVERDFVRDELARRMLVFLQENVETEG